MTRIATKTKYQRSCPINTKILGNMFERPDQNTERHVQFRQQSRMTSIMDAWRVSCRQVKLWSGPICCASITHWILVNFLLINNKKMKKTKNPTCALKNGKKIFQVKILITRARTIFIYVFRLLRMFSAAVFLRYVNSARHVRRDITILDEKSSNYTVKIKMLFCAWEKSKRLVVFF